MFDWLFEGRLTAYLFLVSVAVILLGLWWRDRRRPWLFAAAGVGLFVLTYFLLDRVVETRSEQIARKLQEMAAAVKAGDTNKLFNHISDRFTFAGLDKPRFRSSIEAILRSRRVTDLVVWEFVFPDDTGKVGFRATPKGNEPGLNFTYLVRAQFVRDADGQWRLQTFDVFNPVVDSNKPIAIPQLGG